jgi:hypothetical protein
MTVTLVIVKTKPSRCYDSSAYPVDEADEEVGYDSNGGSLQTG